MFDADDTLFWVYPSVAENYRLILSGFGIQLPEELINTSLFNNWNQLKTEYLNEANGYVTTIQRETAFWLKYAKEVVIDCIPELKNEFSTVDQIVELLYKRFALADSRKLKPEIPQILNHLYSNNYKIGVFTNNDGRILQLLDELNIKQYFSFIEFSGSVGYKKPSVMVFKTLENRYNLIASETIHIGNSDILDIEPANQAGWHAAHISEFIKII